MDTDAVPALAAAGALGVVMGRMLRGRRAREGNGPTNGRAIAAPVTDAAATAGRFLGSAAATAIKAGGMAVQTVGAAVAATGNLTQAAGERVESAVRPARPGEDTASGPPEADEAADQPGGQPTTA